MGSFLSTDSTGIRFLYLIVSTAFLIFFILNAVYFNKVAKGTPGSCSQISQKAAKNLFIINIVLSIIGGIIWLITLLRLFVKPSGINAIQGQISSKAAAQVAGVKQFAQRVNAGQYGWDYVPGQGWVSVYNPTAAAPQVVAPGPPPSYPPGPPAGQIPAGGFQSLQS